MQQDPSTATAQLTEAGSTVTGTVTAHGGGCGFSVSIQATRSGNDLTGIATSVPTSVPPFTGAVTGMLVGSDLHLTVADLTDGAGFEIAGFVVLHRQ